jgi:glycosyltransferase involved in cell wall biosynthesis
VYYEANVMKKEMERKCPSVGIITTPISQSGIVPLVQLMEIIKKFSKSIFIITGNYGFDSLKNDKTVAIYGFKHVTGSNFPLRLFKYFLVQFKISLYILKINKKVKIWFFFIGGQDLIFPMILAKTLKIKVNLIFAGSSIATLNSSNDKMASVLTIFQQLNCSLCDNIIIYSQTLEKEYCLERWKDKIIIAPRHFIDFKKFRIIKDYKKRNNYIGYIGRLSEEKGIISLILSFSRILSERKDFTLFIIGDGSQYNKIKQLIDDLCLNDYIFLLGWLPHDEISKFLNEFKLIVIPSYTEGLPNVLLESMACGTPALVAPVGAIPDIIMDEYNGFILLDNSQDSITKGILKTINSTSMEVISENCLIYVRENFAFENAIDRYQQIFKSDN